MRAHGVDENRYLAAFLAELDHMAALTGARDVASVFFGGGTPSLMRPKTVTSILDRIARNWRLERDAEITLEANPTSVEAEKFGQMSAFGINRVSLGVQSLDDAALKALGRRHSAAEARAAVDVAISHFGRVSFDLIYARPGQRLKQWERELGEALGLGARHLSLYQLTIEAETPFAALHEAGKLSVPGLDHAARLYEATQALTDDAGLRAYEISNHAAPGEECRHNLVYWRSGDYAGVGPGAHGRLTIDGVRHHLATLRLPEAWLASVEAHGHGLDQRHALEPRQWAAEFLLMGIRLAEGFDLDRYRALGGEISAKGLAMLKQQNLVEFDGQVLKAAAEGRLVLDAVIAELSG